jgi:hypothetical protein
MTMPELSRPSSDLSVRLTRPVDYEERIRLIWNNGESDIEETVYSFEEAAHFLDMDDLVVERTGGSTCARNLRVIADWVGKTLGDRDLAQAITEVTKQDGDPRSFIRPIRDLMAQRLQQGKEVLKGRIVA